jgi:hypothetical protein
MCCREKGAVVIEHEHSNVAALTRWQSVNMMNIARVRLPGRNPAPFGFVSEEPFISNFFYPENRYSTFLRNVGKHLPDLTVLQTKIPLS